jgi:hypothetical protein
MDALTERVAGARGAPLILLVLVMVSAAGAVLAARISFGADVWLWNLDMPKIHYPLAVFFHDALEAGGLPLWEDQLGLGFPLYAEGQIGAFYPLNWVIFRFDPLVALDLTRLVHLTLAGTGAGLLALRVAGSRPGALVAALIVVLCGAIVTKLEWWNLVAAYAWMPWVLLPVAGRAAARRSDVALAGVMWGIQALAGHPQTWLLTGLAGTLLLLRRPWAPSLGRVIGFGALGAAVGAVQLIPTALLVGLSNRAGGMQPNELFGNATTPFDVLGLGFVNAFLRASGGEWDYATSWYPDGHFTLLNAGIYVGLPVLALAGIGASTRRARRWLLLAGVMLAIPIAAAFQPSLWEELPVLNGLRSPVRSYMVVSVAIGVLAAIGMSRLGRSRWGSVWGLAAIAIPVGAYVLATILALAFGEVFNQLIVISSWTVDPGEADAARRLAQLALTSPWPLYLELALGLGAAVVISRPRSRRTVAAAVFLAVIPLALLSPVVNPVRPLSEFSHAGSDYVMMLQAEEPHRVLTIGAPGWYPGMPDQLAAAGVPDIGMFTSLNFAAVEDLTRRLRSNDPGGSLRRAVGIDVVVTFGRSCPGRIVAHTDDGDAFVCRVPGSATPPYWLPEAAAQPARRGGGSMRAELDASAAVAAAVPVQTVSQSMLRHEAVVEAPAPGWVWFDRAWWPGWRMTIDGRYTPVYEALGGQLVAVPTGRHRLVAELSLWDVQLGAAVGIVGLVAATAWAWWPARRSGRRPGKRLSAPRSWRR